MEQNKIQELAENLWYDLADESDGWETTMNHKSFIKAINKVLTTPVGIQWVAIKDELPPILETIWLSNGKGWTDLGCRVETNEGWHWAGQNGIIYQEKNQIVAECDSDDLDVVYWCKLPKPPCA